MTPEQAKRRQNAAYFHLPNYDGEFSIWDRESLRTALFAGDLKLDDFKDDAPAELVVSLDGHRGHYLSADFIDEAVALIKGAILDDYNHGCAPKVTSKTLDDWQQAAEDYREHHDDADNEVAISAMEAIADAVHSAEPALADYDYVVEWDDGVRIFKVLDRTDK